MCNTGEVSHVIQSALELPASLQFVNYLYCTLKDHTFTSLTA